MWCVGVGARVRGVVGPGAWAGPARRRECVCALARAYGVCLCAHTNLHECVKPLHVRKCGEDLHAAVYACSCV